MAVRGAIEVAITGEPDDARFRALASVVAGRYVPSLVLAGGTGTGVAGIELMTGRERAEPTAYVCRAYACESPTMEPAVLLELLATANRAMPS